MSFTILLFILLLHSTFNKEITAFANSLKPQPEKFTELYFENHLKLPSKVNFKKNNNFTFTIHNLEYQNTFYEYEVFIRHSDGTKELIDHGSTYLKHNQKTVITISYTVVSKIEKGQIIVELVNRKQQIFFWIKEEINEKIK